jgi:trigger factor
MTMEQMRAQFKDGAERQVRTRLALEKIAALENIEPSEEDYQKEHEKLAEMYKLEIEKIKEQVNSNVLKEDISLRKAVEFIKANANIAEVETTLEEFEADLREKNREPIPDEDEEDDEE